MPVPWVQSGKQIRPTTAARLSCACDCINAQKFQDMAAEDKARYQEEMKSYVPPPEDTAEVAQETSGSEKSKAPAEAKSTPKKKPKKRKRDPNKPKGAKSGGCMT